jgi:hypothetical protein
MPEVPDHFALYAIGAGLVAALVVVALGARHFSARARAFRDRLEGYGELPIHRDIERAQSRLETASESIRSVPRMIARARQAIEDLEDAGARLARAVSQISGR